MVQVQRALLTCQQVAKHHFRHVDVLLWVLDNRDATTVVPHCYSWRPPHCVTSSILSARQDKIQEPAYGHRLRQRMTMLRMHARAHTAPAPAPAPAPRTPHPAPRTPVPQMQNRALQFRKHIPSLDFTCLLCTRDPRSRTTSILVVPEPARTVLSAALTKISSKICRVA